MINNKLWTNLITGTAIVASLTTSGLAGFKVLANRNLGAEVPEVTTPTPTPIVNSTLTDETGVLPSTNPSIIPSSSPNISEFPIASQIPGSRFDDDGDDEEGELEQEDLSEEKEHEVSKSQNRDND